MIPSIPTVNSRGDLKESETSILLYISNNLTDTILTMASM
jgi:hypothetical protein